MRAMEPWLRERVSDERFWDGKFYTGHVGDIDIAPMTDEKKAVFWKRYGELPSPLAGKDVIVVAH